MSDRLEGNLAIGRRTFVFGISAGILAAPLAGSQPAGKVYRIGVVLVGHPERTLSRALLEALGQGLRELGYREGQNIATERRFAESKLARLPQLLADLVRLNVDVIVVGATPTALAARQATKTIPIVAVAMGDPVQDGLVASLARPGGNLTGLTFLGPELVAKRLGLLKECLPRVSRLAVLWHSGAYGERTMGGMLTEADVTARALGVQLHLVEVQRPGDLGNAFSAMTRERVGALLVFPSPVLFSEHRRIVDLAAQSRLPAVYAAREFVDAGGLMAYGASIQDLFRRAAVYMDKIFKGANPADLPVEQPVKFELVINMKTAKALGLTIPPSLLLRAEQVIE